MSNTYGNHVKVPDRIFAHPFPITSRFFTCLGLGPGPGPKNIKKYDNNTKQI